MKKRYLAFILLFVLFVTVLIIKYSYASGEMSSNVYKIIGNKIYAVPTELNLSKEEFINNINNISGYELYNTNQEKINKGNIGTGYSIDVNGKKYKIVLLGDVTGDGSISLSDVSLMYNHYRKNNNIGGYKYQAGLLTSKKDISLGDVSKLYNFYKGKTSIKVIDNNLKLNIDNSNIELINSNPGDSITKTFSVKNNGSNTTNYDIYLSDIVNTFNDKSDLVYKLESAKGCPADKRVVPSISGEESKIVNECSINSGETHEYTLKILFEQDTLPQDDNSNVSFSAKLTMNTYSKNNIDDNAFEVNNVSELKSSNLDVGAYVITNGYYSYGDGGNGYYLIESSNKQTIDDGRYIKLDNGNVAKLIPENNTINVKQFGLIGNGEGDESSKLQLAFNQLKKDDCNTIYIPDGTYNVTKTILFTSGNIIGGSNAKIMIYASDKEHAFANDRNGKTSSEKDTVNINSLKFEVDKQEDLSTGVHMNHIFVVRFFFTDNSSIKNCEFTTGEGNTYGVNSIDLYTSNTNTRIDNITSKIYTSTLGLTTHMCIRERYQNHTSKNIVISNVYGEKNGQDESIWIDAWNGILEDVELYDSSFIDKGVAVSTFFIAANYETAEARNINVHNNTITKEQYSYKILSMGIKQHEDAIQGINENLNFHDNTIIINSNKASGLANGSTIVMIGEPEHEEVAISDIKFENNTIISENASIGNIIKDRRKIAQVKNNTIKVNNFTNNANNFSGIYVGVLSIDNETLSKTDGSPIEAKNIFRNCYNVSNITTSIKGAVVNEYNNNGTYNYDNLNITSTGNVFDVTTKSTNEVVYSISNSTFNNSGYAYKIWYGDLNSSVSSNNKVTFNVTNTTFTNNNSYGSIIKN